MYPADYCNLTDLKRISIWISFDNHFSQIAFLQFELKRPIRACSTDMSWPWHNFKNVPCWLLQFDRIFWISLVCIWVKITRNPGLPWKFKKFCQIAVVSRVHIWNWSNPGLLLRTDQTADLVEFVNMYDTAKLIEVFCVLDTPTSKMHQTRTVKYFAIFQII